MWNEGKKELRTAERCIQHRKAVDHKCSSTMAMLLGIVITVEIMIAGAMLFNFDFRGADGIALLFAFVVLYFGVVAVLTDK